MKTKQEQIEGMRREIENGFRKADCRAPYTNAPYPYFETQKIAIAEALYDAGYGDVSEYKAEIERLEEKCEELRNEKWDAQDDLDCYYDEMPNKIKQAQIDVLNELKDKMFECEYMSVKYKERIFYESEIDDMIAEVQNGKNKG